MKRFVFVLAVLLLPCAATAAVYTFGGGSLTTTATGSWDGYNSQYCSVGGRGFDVDAGPVVIDYKGVNLSQIDYTGDFGWPPDSTDTGASVIVGFGNSVGQFVQYSVKSNMSGSNVRPAGGTGKGSWDHQTTGYWNEDGYRSYLFQGQSTDNLVVTLGNSQYNAEKKGGPTGADNDCDTYDIRMQVEKTAPNTYAITGWHCLWKSSAIIEGCGWDWNYAANAHDPAKRGYLKMFEGTWTADGGLDLSNGMPFLAIQNWQGTQPHLYSFAWNSVEVNGTLVPEPGTLAAVAAGVGCIGTMLRRRRTA